MQPVRCGGCGKLLAVADYRRLQIKCGRCRTLNDYQDSASRAVDLRAESPPPERRRAPPSGDPRDPVRRAPRRHPCPAG